MTGEYQHSIDAKGRLFIPAKLREELGPTFYVTISTDNKQSRFLAAYTAEAWQRLTDKFNSMPSIESRSIVPIFTKAVKCEPDAQGRILLTKELRDYADLEKDAVVLGVSNRAEIWSADKWKTEEQQQLDPQNLSAAMLQFGF